jgi:hypothetical protein
MCMTTGAPGTLRFGLTRVGGTGFPVSRPSGKGSSVTAIELDHPAYDCLYLALTVENDCRFVTADELLQQRTEFPLIRASR